MATSTATRSATRNRPRAGASAAPGSQASARALLKAALNAPLSDYYLVLASAVLLLAFGTMMVLSASSVSGSVWNNDAYYFVKRQALFLAAGACVAWWLSQRDLRTLRTLGWGGLFLAIVLLVLTLATPLGMEVGGNRAWLRLGGGMTLQPSEFAKIAMIVWGADILHRKQKLLDQPMQLLIPFVPVSLTLVALVVLQRDLGTAMVMMLIFMAIMWVIGTPWRLLLLGIAAGVTSVAALVVSSPNRMDRIFGFLNPDQDHGGTNHQQLQAMYSLASGGWWGRGLGGSRGKYGSLAQPHTDMVFAVLGEELGLMGSLTVVLLFAVLGFAGLRIALRSDQVFTKVAAAGITLWFLMQATINIAVVVRLLPGLGVPLPFVSYGGSAILANLVALGFLLACARHEPAARRVLARSKGKLPRLSTVVAGATR